MKGEEARKHVFLAQNIIQPFRTEFISGTTKLRTGYNNLPILQRLHS